MTANRNFKTAVYQVGGLKGNHCRDRIEHTLSHLQGVADVSVDLNSSKITIEYDPASVPSGYLEETLQSLGYSIQS